MDKFEFGIKLVREINSSILEDRNNGFKDIPVRKAKDISFRSGNFLIWNYSTAATGYIGGTVLDTLVKRHPEYNITVLLRNVPEGFLERYPHVKIVKGDFDDEELVSETASQNDIVIREQNLSM